MGASIRRGLAAGLLAGLLAGFFALLVGEIPLREAIALEEQAAADSAGSAAHDHRPDDTHDHGHEEPLVDRWTQQALLPVGSALVGTAFGGLFGLCFALLRPRLREPDPWRASLRLGAVAWVAVALFPGLTYPASPPGVGDPERVGARSGWFLAAIVLAALVAAALWQAAGWLRNRGVPEVPRQLLVAVTGAAGYGGLFWALPAGGSAAALPSDLVWEFRLASLATQLIMWAGIAACFGYLCRRIASGDRLGGEGTPPRHPELL
jgi:predicted cobalt transporter CbtA